MRSFTAIFLCCSAVLACTRAPSSEGTSAEASAVETPPREASIPAPPPVKSAATPKPGAPLDDIVEVACGQAHTCARTNTGAVWCWGRNREKQIGTFDGERSSAPFAIEGLAKVAQLAAGASHTCALASDASVTCWGDKILPHKIPNLKATAIAAGGPETCALTGTGRIYCWQKDLTPAQAPADGDAIVHGSNGACTFRRDASTMQCWANGTSAAAAKPVRTKTLPAKIAWASGDGDKGCAGLANGKTYCWGTSLQGELGTPSPDAGLDAPFLAYEEPASQVVFGAAFTCASVQNAPLCRGSNASGELGRGTKDPGKHPELGRVGGLDKVSALAAGGAHACAVLTNKTVSCWGAGDQGQVGNATLGESPTASLVTHGNPSK